MKPDLMQLADAVWCDLANEGATRDQQTETIARALLDAHQRGRREGLEEAAKVARCAFDDRPRHYSMDWNDGFNDGTKAAEYAIRAKAQEAAKEANDASSTSP